MTDDPSLQDTLNKSWPPSKRRLDVEVVSCQHHHLHKEDETCPSGTLVEEGRETISEVGGKMVVVWDSEQEPPHTLVEALVARQGRGLVEVITVGGKERILHPVLLEALSVNGGGLNVVGNQSQAVELLKHRVVSPWGVAATV